MIKQTRGFTLMECILTISMFSILSIIVMTLYLTGYKYYKQVEMQVEVEQNVRIVIQRISGNIRILEDPYSEVKIIDQTLVVGAFQYYLQNGILYEKKGWGTNQLALHIHRFESQIYHGELSLIVEGKKDTNSDSFQMKLVMVWD